MLRTADLVYLDSSALVKTVVDEPASYELREYLARQNRRASSALARVEFIRAVKLHGPIAITEAHEFLESTYLVPICDEVLFAAADLASTAVRSLDAIHLASALSLGHTLATLVTYDQRMARTALDLGLPVIAPGA